MATQTIVTCDVHGDGLTPGEVVTFGLDGDAFEVDLCDEHAEELRETLSRYVEVARRAGTARRSRPATTGRRTARATRTPRRADLSEVRAWARQQGYEISDRGRIPGAILEEYDARGRSRGRRRSRR